MSASPVFVEQSAALPIVSVAVSFRSGAAHDPEGKEGLARVAARMLRRGAEGWSSQKVEETVDALGGDLAADVGVSALTLHFDVIRRSLEPMVDLVTTLLSRPTFDEDELARLLRESEAEIVEARDNDVVLVGRAFRRALFAGHPYGRRTSGYLGSLRTLDRADVRGFYERHLCRANAAVIVSGDVTEDEGRVVAERLLSGLPEGAEVSDPVPEPVQREGRHLVFVDKPSRTQAQMIMGSLGTRAHDPDHMPFVVANTVFGGVFSSRLMQEIRVKRGWSYGASARLGLDRRREAFSMWTAPSAADAPACLSHELGLLEAFCEGGVTEDELEFVKRFLLRSHAFDIDTARKRAHQWLEAVLCELPPGYHERYTRDVAAVTREAANAAVKARLSPKDLVISVVGTHAEIGAKIEAAIPDLAGVTVQPFDLE